MVLNKSEKILMNIEKLNVFYNEKQALFDISLGIHKNSVTALIGPSGCGKTTFLRCLNRMNDTIESCSVRGSIILDEENIYSDNSDVVTLRSKVGMVFQKPNPFPKSIYQNVAYGLKIHRVTKSKKKMDAIVKDSLKRTGLWEEVKDRLEDSAMGLSGGQQQRLCIARAIAIKPEVILMDEPCSALDPLATESVEKLIEDLKQKFTIIMVTHSMQQAKRISDYTCFFHMGNLIESGETQQVFKNPKNSKTKDYVKGRFG